MDLPAGMENGLVTNALPNGKFSVTMIVDKQPVGRIDADGATAGLLAANFLAVAKVCQEQAGLPLAESHSNNSNRPEIAPSKVAMWECQTPGAEALVLTFGQAQIAVALSQDVLRVIGSNMLSLAGPTH